MFSLWLIFWVLIVIGLFNNELFIPTITFTFFDWGVFCQWALSKFNKEKHCGFLLPNWAFIHLQSYFWVSDISLIIRIVIIFFNQQLISFCLHLTLARFYTINGTAIWPPFKLSIFIIEFFFIDLIITPNSIFHQDKWVQ